MNNKGFTLIELLAVIVVIAIISVITVPLISNIVEKSKRGAFLDSAYGILKASEYEFIKNQFIKNIPEKLIFTYEDGEETSNIDNVNLNYNGKKPVLGYIAIEVDGKKHMAITDGVYCAKKEPNEEKIVITKLSLDNDCGIDNPNVSYPLITIVGDNPTTINVEQIYEDPGAVASDELDGDITDNIIATGEVNPNVPGTYTITYTVANSNNKTSTTTRTVIVVDNVEPVITDLTINVDDIKEDSFIIFRQGDSHDVHSDLSENPYIYEISVDHDNWEVICINNSVNCEVVNLEPETTYYRVCVVDVVLNKACVESKMITTKKPIYVDNSGASYPELSAGMIPIRWDGSKWVKADLNGEWYNYDHKKWANAALVTTGTRNEYQNSEPGIEIDNNDVLAYLVWIPRYKYKLFNVCYTSVPMQKIEIIFEDKETPKSSGKLNNVYTKGEWYTHPAFTFGSTELNGFWIGKYETTGTAVAPTIKPGIPSLRSQNTSAQLATANVFSNESTYGISADIDTHIIKNVEWGALAYLTYSDYGKNSKVWMNPSETYITGCAGSQAVPEVVSGCSYHYDSVNGQEASTTGNVYGVYDTVGGSWEIVMGLCLTLVEQG